MGILSKFLGASLVVASSATYTGKVSGTISAAGAVPGDSVCGADPTAWAAQDATDADDSTDCGDAHANLRKNICNYLKGITPADHQSGFDCDANATGKTGEAFVYAFTTEAVAGDGEFSVAYSVSVINADVAVAGAGAVAIQAAYKAALVTASDTADLTTALTNANLNAGESTDKAIYAATGKGASNSAAYQVNITDGIQVYSYKSHKAELTGSLVMTATLTDTCNDATELASTDCATLANAVRDGACDEFTQAGTGQNWICDGTDATFTIASWEVAARRSLKEESFLGEKRMLTTNTLTANYKATQYFDDATSAENSTMKTDVDTYISEAATNNWKTGMAAKIGTHHSDATFDVASVDSAGATTLSHGAHPTPAAAASEKGAMRTASFGAITAIVLFFAASLY